MYGGQAYIQASGRTSRGVGARESPACIRAVFVPFSSPACRLTQRRVTQGRERLKEVPSPSPYPPLPPSFAVARAFHASIRPAVSSTEPIPLTAATPKFPACTLHALSGQRASVECAAGPAAADHACGSFRRPSQRSVLLMVHTFCGPPQMDLFTRCCDIPRRVCTPKRAPQRWLIFVRRSALLKTLQSAIKCENLQLLIRVFASGDQKGPMQPIPARLGSASVDSAINPSAPSQWRSEGAARSHRYAGQRSCRAPPFKTAQKRTPPSAWTRTGGDTVATGGVQ